MRGAEDGLVKGQVGLGVAFQIVFPGRCASAIGIGDLGKFGLRSS